VPPGEVSLAGPLAYLAASIAMIGVVRVEFEVEVSFRALGYWAELDPSKGMGVEQH